MMKKVSILILVLTQFFLTQFLMSQDKQWNEQIRQMSFLGEVGSTDYVVGPGDLIEIKIFGVESFDQVVRISSSGKISLPFLGKISVAGMTGAELEDYLTQLMGEKRLVRDAQVSVFVQQYRSQPVYVLGAVNQPGQYMISQNLNVIDVIAMAGGLDFRRAQDYALLQRRGGSEAPDNGTQDSRPEPVRIDLKDLLENGNLALNMPVQGGDMIHVPEKVIQLYYVIGEVGRPGAYEFEADETLMVSQALAWAGGPQKTAKSNKGMLVRYDEHGKRTELAVNFKDILKGRKPDFAVEPEDIIFIPGSNFKTIGYGLLGVIPSTVSRTATYAAYPRRGLR